MTFLIGMDILDGQGWVKLHSSTYIRGMCQRWLEYPVEEYDRVSTPSHPKLLEYYEYALMTRGNTPVELMHRYRSLVGALLFPAPMTRPDFLFTAGILARAMDFGTEELFQCALYGLVFLGQTHEDGITYSKHAPDAYRLIWWSDSDWATERSTTGGTGQLAGGSVHAVSRKQDCTTTSSTHAEIVAGSSNSNDALWCAGLCREYGLFLEGPTPFYVDAKNVLTLVQNLVSTKATRHITRRELIIRDREAAEDIVVMKVHTDDNLADMLTKPLHPLPFTKLRRGVMNLLIRVAACLPVRRPRKHQ